MKAWFQSNGLLVCIAAGSLGFGWLLGDFAMGKGWFKRTKSTPAYDAFQTQDKRGWGTNPPRPATGLVNVVRGGKVVLETNINVLTREEWPEPEMIVLWFQTNANGYELVVREDDGTQHTNQLKGKYPESMKRYGIR